MGRSCQALIGGNTLAVFHAVPVLSLFLVTYKAVLLIGAWHVPSLRLQGLLRSGVLSAAAVRRPARRYCTASAAGVRQLRSGRRSERPAVHMNASLPGPAGAAAASGSRAWLFRWVALQHQPLPKKSSTTARNGPGRRWLTGKSCQDGARESSRVQGSEVLARSAGLQAQGQAPGGKGVEQ